MYLLQDRVRELSFEIASNDASASICAYDISSGRHHADRAFNPIWCSGKGGIASRRRCG